MKFCNKCGDEIDTRDGDNRCAECEAIDSEKKAKRAKLNARARANRKARESVMQDLGLVKVRGAMGGVYWE